MLNIDRLENVKAQAGKVIAACPACRAEGGDRAGNHLVIFEDGSFGCVRYAGDSPDACEHRRIIARLAGDGKVREQPKTAPPTFLKLPKLPKPQKTVILGRFGRSFQTYARMRARACACESSEQASEPSVDILDTVRRLFVTGAVWDDPDDMDFETWDLLRLIEGILTLRDGKGRIAYTQSQIESCIIALRGHASKHPKNKDTMNRLVEAKKRAVPYGELARRMTEGHRR